MDKNKIKSYLTSAFVNEVEEKAVGLKKTETIKSQNKKTNDEALKSKNKELDAYSKNLTANKEQNSKEVKKRELDKKEQEIHDNVEIATGTLLNIDYDNPIDKKFAERFEKALVGDPTFGNSNKYANVVQDKVWGGDPNFGQSLVDKTKAMAKIPQNVVGGGKTLFPYGVKNGNFPVNENTDKNIKMKRLIFKKPFNGLDNALNLIPETYRVDDKQFEMTDGTETYKVRWEGTLTEGRAIVLNETNINVVNESIDKIKHLMGFKSEETLGNVRGKNRLDENKMFNDIWNKTKSLLTETEDIEGQDPNEGEFDDVDMVQANEVKKDVEGNVPTEAKMNVQKPKEENWDVNVKGQAEEAKKHIHMNESYMNEEGEEKEFADVEKLKKIWGLSSSEMALEKINTKQELVEAVMAFIEILIGNNPEFATQLKTMLPAMVKNELGDLAQKQMEAPMSEEEETYEEKDRFDEIFEGLDEEEDEINENIFKNIFNRLKGKSKEQMEPIIKHEFDDLSDDEVIKKYKTLWGDISGMEPRTGNPDNDSWYYINSNLLDKLEDMYPNVIKSIKNELINKKNKEREILKNKERILRGN
jgi:hypothetical protein